MLIRVRRIESEEFETIDGQTGNRLCIREVVVSTGLYEVVPRDYGKAEIAFLTEEWIICPAKAAELRALVHPSGNEGEVLSWRLVPFQNGQFTREEV